MYLFYGALIVVFLFGFYCSRRGNWTAEIKDEKYLIPFCRMAQWIEMKIASKPERRLLAKVNSWMNRQRHELEVELGKINPGKNPRQQAVYQQTRRYGQVLAILFLGAVAAFSITVYGQLQHYLQENQMIERPEYGGGNLLLPLWAEVEGYKVPVELEIEERMYTDDELEVLLEHFTQELDQRILGGNSSFDEIVQNMDLINEIQGYPFVITWESSNYDLIDSGGVVNNQELELPCAVSLTANLRYDEKVFSIVRTVAICPPVYTEEERVQKQIQSDANARQKETVYEHTMSLPQMLGENMLVWSERKTDWSIAMFLGALLAGVGIYLSKKQELRKMKEHRENRLLLEYPELVSKITLYLGAGMSMRNVFRQMGESYKTRRSYGGMENPLYEEIVIACNELESGVSEMDVYEHLGKRCGIRQYVRFSAMLNQNLKKGSTNLAKQLEKEAEEAFELRKNLAKKLGEEAGTKLLLPMIMMLCVVMVMIIIPAYFSFNM